MKKRRETRYPITQQPEEQASRAADSGARRSKRAKVFWTGRSQAVRLPKEFRFDTDEVEVRREGTRVILEAVDDWPEGYWENFPKAPDDFQRPPQGKQKSRVKF